MDQFTLPGGQTFGTGLLVPPQKASAFPAYESSGPMWSMDDVIAVAKTRPAWAGSTPFGTDYIKTQKSTNACNGHAGASALTRARVRRGLPRVDLSGAYLYSLVNGGSDNGSHLEAGMKALQQRGVATEATVPWNRIFPSQYDRAKADAEAALYKGFECYAVGTELGLFSALAAGFDCVVAVHVSGNEFMRLDSFGVPGGGQGPGNHAVGCDDLSWDNGLFAESYNSWDTSYGKQGRMRLTWNKFFRHTSPYHMFYAIRSTTDGADSPPEAHT
jgi:hypothetical protein